MNCQFHDTFKQTFIEILEMYKKYKFGIRLFPLNHNSANKNKPTHRISHSKT